MPDEEEYNIAIRSFRVQPRYDPQRFPTEVPPDLPSLDELAEVEDEESFEDMSDEGHEDVQALLVPRDNFTDLVNLIGGGELISGLPGKFEPHISNTGDDRFPGGEIPAVESTQFLGGMRTIDRNEAQNVEIPQIESGNTYTPEINLSTPLVDDVLSLEMELRTNEGERVRISTDDGGDGSFQFSHGVRVVDRDQLRQLQWLRKIYRQLEEKNG